MTIQYEAPALRKLAPSPEVLALLKLLAELHGFELVDKAAGLGHAETNDVAKPPEPSLEPDALREPLAEDEMSRPLSLEQVHDHHVQRVLEMCNGNRAHAAQVLRISRNRLYRTLKRLGLVRRNRQRFQSQADDVAVRARRSDVHDVSRTKSSRDELDQQRWRKR